MTNKTIGEALRDIRKIKGMTQSDVANKELTRSSITKIETNKMNPSYEKIMVFCQQLGVNLAEVVYYQHNKSVSEREMLFYEFRNLKLSVYEDPLLSLIRKMDDYLSREKDIMIFELRAILKGAKYLNDSNDIERAKKEVSFIWNRLEKQDEWFEFDVLLISNIIYVFDLDTLIILGEKLIDEVEKNKYLISYNRLKTVLMMNIALFLKQKGRMDLVKKYLDKGIEFSYKNNDLVSAYLGKYRLAEYYLYIGEYEKAEDMNSEAVSFFEEINDEALLEDIRFDWNDIKGKLKLD
ncbi:MULTISPECIES: helix-turn-helix domain-containing protein [unclassified Listeria]|uniref:helix-turn-helix domain-containing protein n=1 Tax=unclassified Listeria TaxID=2642072 RepID=UPI000B58B651|nr:MULTISPECIES: helix-turn-helix transcriptional regulator [unclassified Listeria]